MAGKVFLESRSTALDSQTSRQLLRLGEPNIPVTVLSVISTLARGGPVNVLEGIVQHYDLSNYRPVIATLSPEPTNSGVDEFRRFGIHVEEMNLSRPGSLLRGPQKLRALTQSRGAELVHCHGFRADVLAARAHLSVPTVSTIHSDLFDDYRLSYGRLAGSLMAQREYMALRQLTAAVSVSETVRDAAIRFGVDGPVIRNGIDLHRYAPAGDEVGVRDIRARLGWPQDGIVVLHMGALIPLKRPLEVIRQFRRSNLTTDGFLVFAGDGSMREACERAAAGTSNIRFLGRRTDVADLLRASDAVVSASSSEGCPLALLEACASGVRVVASAISAHQEIKNLFPDQVALFSSDEIDSLARTLDTTPPTAVRRGERWRSQLNAISSETMSASYQELYGKLTRHSGHRPCRTETAAAPQSAFVPKCLNRGGYQTQA